MEVCISACLLARTFLLAKWNHNSSKSTYVGCLKQLLKNLILQHFFFFFCWAWTKPLNSSQYDSPSQLLTTELWELISTCRETYLPFLIGILWGYSCLEVEWYSKNSQKHPSPHSSLYKKGKVIFLFFFFCSPFRITYKLCWSLKKKYIAAALVCIKEKADPISGSLQSKCLQWYEIM